MNIVFLHRLWPSYGGGETVTKCIAAEFIRRGHQVHVLYFKRNENTGDSAKVDKRLVEKLIPNVDFDETASDFRVKNNVAKRVSSFTQKYVQDNSIDIVINQWWPVEFLQGISQNTNVKVIKCLHMDPDTKLVLSGIPGLKGKIYRALEPIYRVIEKKKHLYSCDKFMRNSDLFVFLAPSFKKFYLENTKVKGVNEKAEYCYNPLVYPSTISVDDIKQKKKTVLVVGRLKERHKQISRILKIWKSIDVVHLSEWRLQIVGDGQDRKQYEEYVVTNGLKNVTFEGFQDPRPYYKEASIFLMCSAYEGWGMTIVEAQQNGVVPIAMNTYQSLTDIVQDKYNGLITSTKLDEFKSALLYLMDNKEERNLMATTGLKTCQRYAVDNVVDRWENILDNLLNL